ncbi:hypothetical protein GLOIN_2v1789307 [Rhizophagus irregularis DAOM 181602=DAOM 197198]|nr:hypothetical protein GLOIN_2v1789307 [Rhizophagus irregularis DAOM 181602=DAOM 197198]
MSVPSSQSTVLPASSPLIITSASNLTSDEKQNLLFDVDRALEIPMEVLTKSGGPSSNVVQVERHKNSPNHTHSLSEIDRLKRPKAIRSLVEIEAVKNYSAPTITSAVKEYATLELGLSEPARELKRKEVANIKYKVRGPAETYLIGNPNLKLDISDSISYLTEQGYHIEKYCISQRSIRDSTHKTNRYDWRLFILYVRITYGCWNVDAHFFVSSEDADTVAEALIIIRNKYCHWSPPPVTYFQIIVISKPRALKRHFLAWPLIGCESLVQDTINSCPVPSIQITSTNSLEFFHSELKKTTSSSHGLIGAAHKVVNVESASFDFRIKKISAYGVDVDILEEIQKFPFPFQQLIIREACAVMNRLEKEKKVPFMKKFLKELDRKYGANKFTCYLQKFEEEEIRVNQLFRLSDAEYNLIGISKIGIRQTLRDESKKFE